MGEEPKAHSWWQTLPGLITAAAALITALAGAVVGLHQAGLFKWRVDVPPVGSGPATHQEGSPPGNRSRQGDLADEQSTHSWSFQVRKVWGTDEYGERYCQEQRLVRPQGEGDRLIVIDARLKNRLQKTQTPVLTERQPGNTGLIDDAGHSYQPVDYDARQLRDKVQSYEGAPLLPGAVADFALVFSVPRGTRPTSLVFTLIGYPNLSQGTDVRVSLTK